MAKNGTLPAPIKLSERVTVWKLSDIEAFIASRMEAVA
jgi:predicted DNA-binding transcriptional regulator AlpA